jgi:hypothetical protein
MQTELPLVTPPQPGLSPINTRHLSILREAGKIDRLLLTDAISRFASYRDRNGIGSKHPERAFANITRSIYAAFGLNKKLSLHHGTVATARNGFNLLEVRYLQLAETTVAEVIVQGIRAGKARSEIKSKIKQECLRIASHFQRLQSGMFGSEG